MTVRRRIAGAVVLAGAISLGGVIAAAALVLAIAAISPSFVLTDTFFWASFAALPVVHLGVGVPAGRLAVTRLARAGLTGRARILTAAAGPAAVAFVTNLFPVEGVPPVLGTLLPVAAAAGGAALGARLAGAAADADALAMY